MIPASEARRLGIAIDDGMMTLVCRVDGAIYGDVSAILMAAGTLTEEALGSLVSAAPAVRATTITLLRPIAQTRTVPLPAMARVAAERVLTRDWARHTIGIRDTEHSVSAERADRGRWRASFAPSDLLDTLGRTAVEQGWHQLDIRTGDDAIAGAVSALAPMDAREDDLIAVVCDATGPTDAFHLRRGAPWLGRHFLDGAGDDDVATFAQTHASKAPIVVFGGGARATALTRALGVQGLRARVIATGLPADASAAATFAALGTLSSARLPLRAPAMAAAHAGRMRRVTRWLAIAAAAALLGAVALERARVNAALDDVRVRRADISAKVSNAVAARSEIEAGAEIVNALAAREAQVSRTSAVLASVTLALPVGTALTALSVSGDSVTVEGESSRSAAVYESLRGVPLLEQIKLAAPLRQERQAGDVAVEHFAFSAHVRPPAPLATPASFASPAPLGSRSPLAPRVAR